MGHIEKTVFISYRRTNAPWALAIFQNLTNSGYDAFFDFNGIASGDFESVILENIRSRAHFVILLTPSALERCSDPDDWLRREIEAALELKRNIVPLMLEGFDFSTPAIASQLTGSLAPLQRYNALRVPAEFFMEAMDRLRSKYLNVPLDAVRHPRPASATARQAAKVQQADAVAAPAVHEHELSAQTYFERGFDAIDLDESIRFYTEAIRLQPNFHEAFNNRGLARYDKGDVAGALVDYDEAIRLKPSSASAYYNRGSARKAKGDVAGALADYDEAIRLRPDYATAYNNRGRARYDKGDVEGALADFDEAIRLKPDYATAYNNRGRARYDKGDAAGALSDFDEAIRLKPSYAAAYNNRGSERYNKGDAEGALSDFDEAIRLKPNYPGAYYNRGTARKAKGDVKGALADYDEAIRLKPDESNAYYNRAQLRKKNSEHRAAVTDFEKYLELGGGELYGNRAEVEDVIRDVKTRL